MLLQCNTHVINLDAFVRHYAQGMAQLHHGSAKTVGPPIGAVVCTCLLAAEAWPTLRLFLLNLCCIAQKVICTNQTEILAAAVSRIRRRVEVVVHK